MCRTATSPNQNVRGGSTYLDALLTRYHDNLALALAAYNAGPAAVDKYHGIPPYHETQAYVARVIHEFNRRVLAREAQPARSPHLATHGPCITRFIEYPSLCSPLRAIGHKMTQEVLAGTENA